MNLKSKRDYLNDLREEYFISSKKRKGEILDENKGKLGWSRKHIIRQISLSNDLEKPIKRRRKKYYTDDLKAPLEKIWEIFNQPCSAALKEIIANELKRLRELQIIFVSDLQAEKLLQVSARTIETMLTNAKNKAKSERMSSNKKSNPLLMKKIKTKLSSDYDRSECGYIQIDAVEHCGETASGEYAITISSLDIASYWFESEAIMGKGQQRSVEAINNLRTKMPFKWKEIHPDNGSNFINYHLYNYTEKTNLKFTRSRAYKKNDNCFIEQSNGAVIRNSIGHLRYDTEEEVNQINEVYRLLSLFRNFFHPVQRLMIKERDKGHIKRKYFKPTTPYHWLINSDQISEEQKERLNQIHQSLNIIELRKQLDEAILKLFNLNNNKKNAKKQHTNKQISVTSLIAQQPRFRCPT